MAGCIRAIFNFGRVSFSEGRGELRRLELGDKTVLLERSRQLILAVVFAGKTQGELDREMRAFLWRAGQKYADRLADWGGEPEEGHELTPMTGRVVARPPA